MSLISIQNSRVSISKNSAFKSFIPKTIEAPDYFWTDLISEPNYTDTPDGVITYDSATTSLLISDRTALTDYQDTSASLCFGSLNASNCTSLNSVTLGLTYVQFSDFSNSSIQSLDLNYEPEIKTVITTNCSNLTSLNLFYVGTYNVSEYYPSFDLSTSPNLNSLSINYIRTNGLNLSGNTQLTNLELGLSINNSYMGYGEISSPINISNSNIQTCNVAYSYCSEFYADNCTSLTSLNLTYTFVTNLSLTNLPACTTLLAKNSIDLETVELNNIGCSQFEINNSPLLTSLSITNCSSLNGLYVFSAPAFSNLTLSGSMSLGYVGMANNGWGASTVDQVLLEVEASVISNNSTGGILILVGNTAPTATGQAAKTNLENSYSWFVLTE